MGESILPEDKRVYVQAGLFNGRQVCFSTYSFWKEKNTAGSVLCEVHNSVYLRVVFFSWLGSKCVSFTCAEGVMIKLASSKH